MAKEQFIDMTPDKQGYATMAALFGENLVGQIKGTRQERENAQALMGSVINIAAHLGNAMASGDEEARRAYDWLVERFPQGK
jgi:hypothetical protein